MYHYQAYGLRIASTLPLSNSSTKNGRVDVFVHKETILSTQGLGGDESQFIYPLPNGDIMLHWPTMGRLLLRNGREILVDLLPGTSEDAIRQLIMGPALGIILLQRGMDVFHASTVAYQGMAVAFMARKGEGKSSMALAASKVGAELIADDILVCDEHGGVLFVYPGFPWLKLWPDTLAALGETPQSLPRVYPQISKRIHRNIARVDHQPRPLGCIFILEVGRSISIKKLPLRAALMKMLPHWYGALFQGNLLPIFGHNAHFRACTQLVNRVPVYLLERPANLALLPAVARTVECFLKKESTFLQPDYTSAYDWLPEKA